MNTQPPNDKLIQYVDRLIASRYRTASKLAASLGITESAFSRAIHKQGTLSLENCLRLADASGDDPCVVLRIAGKLDHAALLQRLLGEDALSPRACRYIRAWQKRSRIYQDHVAAIVEGLPHDPLRASKRR